MLPDSVSNPGPLTYKSGDLPIALHGPASPREQIFLRVAPNEEGDGLRLSHEKVHPTPLEQNK